jgi:hypothetical protein
MTSLQLNWTDPRTGAAYPQAVLVIADARVHLAAGQAILSDAIFASPTAATGGKAPILSEPEVLLSPAELQTLRTAFEQQLYQILAARYPGSVILP